MKPKSKAIILTVGIVLLGFFREYLFVNINWIYLTLVNGRKNGALPEFHFLLTWSPEKIIVLKWILTGLFTVLFFALTRWIIRVYFNDKKFTKIVLYVYLVLLSLAAILFILGHLTGLYSNLYGAIHNLIAMAQSFMPLMMLFVLFTFFKTDKSISR